MSLLRRDFLISGAEGLENEIIAWPTSRRAILLNIFLPRINRRWPGEEGEGGFLVDHATTLPRSMDPR